MKKVAYGIAGFISFFLQWGSLSSKISIKQLKEHEAVTGPDTRKELMKALDVMDETIEHKNLDEEEY